MPHTPGPWTWITPNALSNSDRGLLGASTEWDDEEGCVVGRLFVFNPCDRPLIAQAPEMYALLKELEFIESSGVRFCPCCNNCWGLPKHDADCRLAAILEAVEGEDAR